MTKQYWTAIVAVAVAVAVFSGPASALAGGKKGGGKGKAAFKPVVWLVASVGPNTCTLTKSDNSEQTNLTVAAETQIVIKGQPGKLADIQAGMRAEFVATGAAVTLLTVDAYIPPADQGARDGKAGKAGKAKGEGKRK